MRSTETPKRSLEEIPQYRISVYPDDFISTEVENASRKLLDRISMAAFHGIQIIFPCQK